MIMGDFNLQNIKLILIWVRLVDMYSKIILLFGRTIKIAYCFFTRNLYIRL